MMIVSSVSVCPVWSSLMDDQPLAGFLKYMHGYLPGKIKYSICSFGVVSHGCSNTSLVGKCSIHTTRQKKNEKKPEGGSIRCHPIPQHTHTHTAKASRYVNTLRLMCMLG